MCQERYGYKGEVGIARRRSKNACGSNYFNVNAKRVNKMSISSNANTAPNPVIREQSIKTAIENLNLILKIFTKYLFKKKSLKRYSSFTFEIVTEAQTCFPKVIKLTNLR